MRVGLRQKKKHGRAAVFADESDGLLGIARRQRGEIGLLFDDVGVVHQHTRVHVVAIGDAEVFVKTAAGGQVLDRTTQVPLADADGPVASILEYVGERDFIQIHAAFILRKKHVRNADACGIAAGQQCRARRRANRIGRRKIGEPHAGGGHAIEIGRRNLRTVAAQIAVTQIVAKDEDDVGRFRRSTGKTPCQCGRHGGEKGTALDHSRIIILTAYTLCVPAPERELGG